MKHFGTQHDKYWFRPGDVRRADGRSAASRRARRRAEAFHVRKLVI